MRVYRCISANEITNTYKGINERSAIVRGQNTHFYEKDKEYIHFFRYSQSAENYKNNTIMASINPLDRYVLFMTANIPNDILDKYMEYGIYNSDNIDENLSKSEQFNVKYPGYIPLPEYVIPEKEFKKNFIVEINNHIGYKLKSNENEYKKYILLLDILYDKYKDYYKVTEYLKKANLQELLNVKDDERTEEQIDEDKINEILSVFTNEDLFR